MTDGADFNPLPPDFEERMKRKRARTREERSVDDDSSRPESWGPYRLLEAAGEGPTARVYRARREGESGDVAVKILRRAVVKGAQTPGARADFLLGNASTIVGLRHPNLVPVRSIENHGGKTGLVMPWIEGPTLDDALRAKARLGVMQALNLGRTLCEALAVVHAEGLVHNDVEARNIVLRDSGVVLMDISSACEFGTERGDRGIALSGTPQFMAPELLEGRAPTPKSDLYAVGVVLFLALSGRHPVKGPMVRQLREAHQRGERRRLHDLLPNLPTAVCELVEQALAADPDDRPSTAREMAEAIGKLAELDLQELERQDRGALARWWGGLPGFVRVGLIVAGVGLFLWLVGRNR